MIDDYEERFCLFIDILGFKDIVENSVKEQNKNGKPQTSEIYFGLKKIASTMNYKSPSMTSNKKIKTSSRKVTQFSDSVVVSYRVREVGSLATMLYDVLHLQLKLIQRKMLVRGAITKGKLYHNQDFVFGPALNEAAQLEKLAMYPRVIVDRGLLEEAEIIRPGFQRSPEFYNRTPNSLVARDLDGLFYVDYFSVYPDDFDTEWTGMGRYLTELREVVKNLSQKKQPTLKMKHSWLRQKFNDIAEKIGDENDPYLNGFSIPMGDQNLFFKIQPFR